MSLYFEIAPSNSTDSPIDLFPQVVKMSTCGNKSIIFVTFAPKLVTMVIGRKEEINKLNRAFDSEYAEFVAVYGRRRIGKTFLIRETFKGRFTFQYTGVLNVSNQEQIEEFYNNLLAQGLPKRLTDAKDMVSGVPSP